MTTAVLTSAALVVGAITVHSQQAPQQVPQQGGAAAAPSQEMIEAQQLQIRVQEIETQLQAIAAEAERANPELVEERTAFVELFESKLEARGYPDQEGQQRLQELQLRLQTPQQLEDEERQRITAEYEQAVTQMRQAETAVREDPEFQRKQSELLESRIEAMTEINPEVPAMEREREEAISRLNALMHSMQQGGQP